MRMRLEQVMARIFKKILQGVIYAEANTASSYIAWQPKAPEKLAEYRRK